MNPLFILAVSLFVISLCGPIIIEPIIAVRELWVAKEFIALLSILLITISAYIRGHEHKAAINWPLLALMFFLPISIYAAPPLRLMYGHENIAGLWMWRSLAWCFAYFMLYCAVCANPPVRERQKRWIIWCIGWAAIISAGYAYIQFIGLDQWQLARSWKELTGNAEPGSGTIKSVNVTGMIGNPTYLGVWLAMCLPFLVLFFRWYWAVFVWGAIFLCQSDIATIGSLITLFFIVCMRVKSMVGLKIGVVLAGVACFVLWGFWSEIRPKIVDNGRFPVWAQTFEDWKSPCIKIEISEEMSPAQRSEAEMLNKRTYALTGRGLGSFPFIFSPKYETRYESAHNEHLEGLYSIGLIGQMMFLASIGFVFWFAFWIARSDMFALALYTSLFFCFLASIGLPILHVEPLRYFSAIMFCLLSALIPRRQNTK